MYSLLYVNSTRQKLLKIKIIDFEQTTHTYGSEIERFKRICSKKISVLFSTVFQPPIPPQRQSVCCVSFQRCSMHVSMYVNIFLKTQKHTNSNTQCVVFVSFFHLIIYLGGYSISVPKELFQSFNRYRVLQVIS